MHEGQEKILRWSLMGTKEYLRTGLELVDRKIQTNQRGQNIEYGLWKQLEEKEEEREKEKETKIISISKQEERGR